MESQVMGAASGKNSSAIVPESVSRITMGRSGVLFGVPSATAVSLAVSVLSAAADPSPCPEHPVMSVIANGMVFLKVSVYLQAVVIGVIIILAVGIDQYNRKRQVMS